MESLDLNIDNYNYEDILNLFKIKIDFGENDLKKVKKHVLQMHPDKSGLDKKYFLFFSATYKILFSVYQFREKTAQSEKLMLSNDNIEYLAEKDENNEEIIKSLKNNNQLAPENFNKWFNEQFEKVKLGNEYQDGGYGDWLKTSEDCDTEEKCNNTREMNEKIDQKKERLRTTVLSKYNGINEFNSSGYCDLTNSRPEEYSSGMFSKLQYEDLKKAHEESVVPVTEKDYKQRYNSIDDIKGQRQQQILDPLSNKDANNYLNKEKKDDNISSSHRAYKLLKQEELANKANNKWWASLKQLK